MNNNIIQYNETNKFLIATVLMEDFGFYEIDNIKKINNKKIKDLNYPNFILDLNKISYIDSYAISFLINLKNTLEKKGKNFSIVCNNQNILMITNMTNMNKIIKIFDSLDLAIEYITA